jgi:hypothetical protein
MKRDSSLSGELRKALVEVTAAMDRPAISYALIEWIESEWQNLAGLDDPRRRRLLEMVSESRPKS